MASPEVASGRNEALLSAEAKTSLGLFLLLEEWEVIAATVEWRK